MFLLGFVHKRKREEICVKVVQVKLSFLRMTQRQTVLFTNEKYNSEQPNTSKFFHNYLAVSGEPNRRSKICLDIEEG